MVKPQDTLDRRTPGPVLAASANDTDTDTDTDTFAQALIRWQVVDGRHRLPWQKTREPYRVWLSEIMLQQTQVAAVIPYYARFLAAFPTVESLAHASLDEVMQQWSGLGYYSRARNLHACAKAVMSDHGGVFPGDAAGLETLPGIGRSTAAAIAVFCYGESAPILDGNVKRVLCRVFALDDAPGAAFERVLWAHAQALLPSTDIESYTQGLMDLGATVCTPRNPSCLICPMASRCKARLEDRISDLPRKRVHVAIPTRRLVMVLVRDAQDVLLEKRPDTGIWGGLWSLPEWPEGTNENALLAFAQRWGDAPYIVDATTLHHAFTHYRLQAEVFQIRVVQRRADETAVDGASVRWLALIEAANAALPAPIKTLFATLALADSR